MTVENFLTAKMKKLDLDADTTDHFAGYLEYCKKSPNGGVVTFGGSVQCRIIFE